jgi:CD109 antigen
LIDCRKLPRGCGEQRLVGYVPIISAIKYLNFTNQLGPELKERYDSILITGYNQMLERKNRDGSFNLWGYHKSDSIWLTAYILKCLGHVKDLIPINKSHIKDAMKFLASKQNSDGGFTEHGPLSNKRIQGGVNNNVALAAYVAVSFLENSDYRAEFQHVIDKALTFANRNILMINDTYTTAICTYAFVLAKDPSASNFISYMKSTATLEEDMMQWDNELGNQRSESLTRLSTKIEIAAYSLLALLKSGDETSARQIMNWMVTKRNVEGGFYSTQDTVMGLQALAEIAKVHYSSRLDMNIKFEYLDKIHVFEVKKADRLMRQNLDLPSQTQHFTLSATGQGKAFVNFWKSYNIKSPIPSEHFKLSLNVLSAKNGGIFYLTACVKYLDRGESSNMVVMEISLPSGYVYDSDSTSALKEFNVKVRKTFV